MNGTAYSDHGIDAPAHGSGEYRATCPKCSADRTKRTEKCLAVALDRGTWFCHHCGWTGGLSPERSESRPAMPQERAGAVAPVKTRALSSTALAWLQSRGISRSTAEEAGVTSGTAYFRDDGGEREAVAFCYSVEGKPAGIKYRALTGKAFTQTRGGCKTAYLHDLAVGYSQIVLTEGEVDALTLVECGIAGAVSCPEGAPPVGARPDGKLEFLDTSTAVFKGAETVVLAMDADEPGVAWRDAIAQTLGPERCLTVTWPAGCKDANEVLTKHGKDAVLAAVRAAKPYPCPGLHSAGEYLEALLARHSNPASSAGYSTGWANLDTFLHIELGSLHVVTGIPGSGKSELLDGIALNTARLHGWRWAVFSPENYPVDRHCAKLVEKHLETPFRQLTADDVRQGFAWVDEHFAFITEDDRGLTVERLANLLKAAAARYGIRGAIVDPWNELEHTRPQHVTESEYIGSALTQLRNIARREGIALFIAAHPTKMERLTGGDYGIPTPYDISGSANWRNKADVCIAVWRKLAQPDNKAEILVQKIRHRDAGKLGRCTLYWQSGTGTYTDYMAQRREY
jgi:twinkle protein